MMRFSAQCFLVVVVVVVCVLTGAVQCPAPIHPVGWTRAHHLPNSENENDDEDADEDEGGALRLPIVLVVVVCDF
ncbi:MAG: hypothetical protein JO279_07465 [Verrucomicrobia bacterium]|nr:hypothetical protein [Verrucomicrobiota bacterium]